MQHQHHLGVLWPCVAWLLAGPTCLNAEVKVGAWEPLFPSIEHAIGTEDLPSQRSRMVVHALRIDLSDPGVRIVTTPPHPNYHPSLRHTMKQSVEEFLRANDLLVAVNANFFTPSDRYPTNQPALVQGLHVSEGRTVAASNLFGVGAFPSRFPSSILFGTNKEVSFIFTNRSPSSLTGVFNAVSGSYPLVIEGVSVANNRSSPISGYHPRTAIGASSNGRFLFLLTIDGRDPAYGLGAQDEDTAQWLLRFGAHNGINLDGGGSTAMLAAKMDCFGNPGHLNVSSNPGRPIGSHLGIRIQRSWDLVQNLQVVPGLTNAQLTWSSPVASQFVIRYAGLGEPEQTVSVPSLDGLQHQVVLGPLDPGSRFQARIRRAAGEDDEGADVHFSTTNHLSTLVGLSQRWRYTRGAFPNEDWAQPDFNDGDWEGGGYPLFNNHSPISPVWRTRLNQDFSSNPGRVYYFRTHFDFRNSSRPICLTFSNILSGSLFECFLNGKKVFSDFVYPPEGRSGPQLTNYPIQFTLRGESLKRVVPGDNVLAASLGWQPTSTSFGPTIFLGAGDLPGSEPEAPRLFQHPADQHVFPADPAAFGVWAAGTEPIGYQWFFNDTPIPTWTNAMLKLDRTGPTEEGRYHVVATNSLGSVTSSTARLKLLPPPSLLVSQYQGRVYLSWSAPSHYALQETAELRANPVWLTLQIPAQGAPHVITNLSRKRFFRLAR